MLFRSGLAGQRPDVNAARASVLVALQEAFYQLAHADGFEEGVVASVSGGGDSHWRGAITGALLGAREGSRRLPSRWVLPVLACRASSDGDAFRPRPRDYWPDDVLDIAEALLKLASP